MTSAARAAFPNPRGEWRGRRCFVFVAALFAGVVFGEEPLEKVIDLLADEDPAIREHAERTLVARGAEALDVLERRKVNCSWHDAEGNARLANAISRIRDDAAWSEAERRARGRAARRMCVHCRETAEVDVVRLRDEFLSRSIRGARLVALRGACCAEATTTWKVLLIPEDGVEADVDFENAGALLARLKPVEDAGDACLLAAALEAALREPGRFEEARAEWLSETEVTLQDETQMRVQCGHIVGGHTYFFDAEGNLTGVQGVSW